MKTKEEIVKSASENTQFIGKELIEVLCDIRDVLVKIEENK
jgi:hypothetical protein